MVPDCTRCTTLCLVATRYDRKMVRKAILATVSNMCGCIVTVYTVTWGGCSGQSIAAKLTTRTRSHSQVVPSSLLMTYDEPCSW